MLIKLREARKAQALSQRDLAEKSGVSHTTISRLELGHQSPTHGTVLKLAKALGVGPNELFSDRSGDSIKGSSRDTKRVEAIIEEAESIWDDPKTKRMAQQQVGDPIRTFVQE